MQVERSESKLVQGNGPPSPNPGHAAAFLVLCVQRTTSGTYIGQPKTVTRAGRSTQMGTLNAFYVRTGADHVTVTEAIRAHFPKAEIEASTQFVGVRFPDDAYELPERKLADLSSRLTTDVVWLSFQSVVDAFQFHHWRAGEHVRSLVYGAFKEERTWERAEGAPEPWEREVLFRQGELEDRLEYSESDHERRELERIWRDAEIQPGRTEPSMDARECARGVAAYFHFPGWGL